MLPTPAYSQVFLLFKKNNQAEQVNEPSVQALTAAVA